MQFFFLLHQLKLCIFFLGLSLGFGITCLHDFYLLILSWIKQICFQKSSVDWIILSFLENQIRFQGIYDSKKYFWVDPLGYGDIGNISE